MSELQNANKEQMAKYIKVKKALFSIKDAGKEQAAAHNQASDDLDKLTKAYEELETKYKELQSSKTEREKTLKKQIEKTKQRLEKIYNDYKEAKKTITEQEKSIAGFTKAQE